MSATVTVSAYLDWAINNSVTSDIGFYYAFLLIPLVIVSIGFILSKLRENEIKQNYLEFKKDEEFLFYINCLLDYIQNRKVKNKDIKLRGMIVQHIKICQNQPDGCNCLLLSDIIDQHPNGLVDNNDLEQQLYQYFRHILELAI